MSSITKYAKRYLHLFFELWEVLPQAFPLTAIIIRTHQNLLMTPYYLIMLLILFLKLKTSKQRMFVFVFMVLVLATVFIPQLSSIPLIIYDTYHIISFFVVIFASLPIYWVPPDLCITFSFLILYTSVRYFVEFPRKELLKNRAGQFLRIRLASFHIPRPHLNILRALSHIIAPQAPPV